MDCAAKAKEWDERQKSVAEELAAIAKAKDILSDGVTVLLQVKRSIDDVENSKRQRIVGILRNLAEQGHVYALSQLASEAQSDQFAKIRGLIESMIDRLRRPTRRCSATRRWPRAARSRRTWPRRSTCTACASRRERPEKRSWRSRSRR